MIRRSAFPGLTTVLLLVAGCHGGTTSTPFDLAAIQKIIAAKNAQFTAAHVTGDIAVLDSYFTDDARVYPPNMPVVAGTADIHAVNQLWIGFGIREFREETTAVHGNEEVLVEEGRYFMTYGEEGTVENGKYINIWRYVDGDWKVRANIWNSSMPATP